MGYTSENRTSCYPALTISHTAGLSKIMPAMVPHASLRGWNGTACFRRIWR
jgi:hypothetical protein